MAVSVEEILMAPGSWSLDCDWDIDVAQAVSVLPGPHLQLWWGEKLHYTGVILTATPAKTGISLGGHSLLWWLGVGTDGPVIEDREYLAGTNKLGNGGFELGDLYWTIGDDSRWVIDQTGPTRTGTWSARMTAVAGVGGDPLSPDFNDPAEAGQTWVVSAWVRRLDASSVGGIRLLVTYEGLYRPPNLVANPGFASAANWTFGTNVSGAVVALAVESGALRLGPVIQPQLVSNGGFDFDFSGWSLTPPSGSGNWYRDTTTVYAGTASASTSAGGPATKYLRPVENIPMAAGERYRFSAAIFAATGSDGRAQVVLSLGGGVPSPQEAFTPELSTTELGASQWKVYETEFYAPDGVTALVPYLLVRNHTVGFWSFDSVRVQRLSGNEVIADSDGFAVVPGLSYDAKVTVWTAGTAAPEGEILIRVRLTAPGRPSVVIEGPSSGSTAGEHREITMSFTPPSGYDTAHVQIVGRDILGQPFWADDVDVRQSDETVTVDDVVHIAGSGAGWQQMQTFTLPPVGTERIRVDLVAESGTQWAVDDASISRFGFVPDVGDIVEDLLNHPDTGLPLLSPGTITGGAALIYDWRIHDLTCLAAIQHLSRAGLVLPVCEYRVNPDATFDWGVASDVFEDRDLVFAGDDLEVLADPDVTISGEDRITKVRAIGADRKQRNGEHVMITGEATNPTGGAVDWFGHPLARTRLVQDSTLEHPSFAAAYARYVADMAVPTESLRLGLGDWSAVGEFDVGDSLLLWKPEAGLEDIANERPWKGRTVYPVRRRVISRSLRPGPSGFRAELRLPDGSTMPLAVRWEAQTSAEIEVGDPRPEFAPDPQGGPGGLQLLRFRAGSRP